MRNLKDKKILIIEDNPMHQFMYKFQFEQAGCTDVMVAKNGEEGLDQVRSHKPDLVILDLILEGDHGLDGIDVLKNLKADESTKEIPVVVLSNKRAKDMAAKVKSLGAVEYLLKADYVPREVVTAVEKYLDK